MCIQTSFNAPHDPVCLGSCCLALAAPVSVSLSCTPSVNVIILYPKCQCHYPVPQVSMSLSCTPSVSVIILYPNVSVIILYPKCQRHYPVPQVSVSLSSTPSVSVIILYPKCQVQRSLQDTPCNEHRQQQVHCLIKIQREERWERPRICDLQEGAT
ncbi:unnamed protein product [Ranitomeya imitator]|uniref:Uncharacterized protein n=1 Tax=Ranitomeya imitator TaxID=111125 RepID=A0ABN9KY99_9NEOB|nr:unnamed protein product [Ranitomeya imitator]